EAGSLRLGPARNATAPSGISLCNDALEDPAPMTPQPLDVGCITWKPVIPEREYQHFGKVEEGEASLLSPAMTLSSASDSVDKVPVVNTKVTHVIMNSLITKQTPEGIQHFRRQAGLRDAGYIPHKGLITEETKQPASTQSTPSTTPHSFPKRRPRGWFTSGSSTALPGPNPSTMDSGSGDKDRNLSDKWRAQKPLMELICAQANQIAEDPAALKLPKMDIPVMEGKKQPPWTHNLKPRDLNVLTPTGF
uniref:Putative monooxygenase p33MONOX n=1 Tax=Saimiri boliviensis boliviensis TaxID=39432 RepID=A0A2K6SBK3_SAIBB